MCGIFGQSAAKGKKINLKKIQVLALYNTVRGLDSCGYYWSGNIAKGIDANKNIADFMVTNPFVRGGLPAEVFLGHTRKATGGTHNLINAHPHQVDDYVQTHNGTLRDWYALAKKYEIDTKDIPIDSILLANIIKHRGFDVLNHYDGAAALAMTYTSDPHKLLLYHGASKDFASDKFPKEERPLFYVETPEGLYYSSIENSLKYITEGKEEVKMLPHNGVFTVEHGIMLEEFIQIDREEANVYKSKHTSDSTVNAMFNDAYKQKLKEKFKNKRNKGDNSNTDGVATIPPIWRESYPLEAFIDVNKKPVAERVYYRFGRHLKGDNMLLNGAYTIDRDGYIIKEGEKSKRQTEMYYFIRGMMMKDKLNYTKALETFPEVLQDYTTNICFYMSQYTRYPVTCLNGEAQNLHDTYHHYWFKDGKKFSGSIDPKFTERKYNCKEGEIKTVTKAYNEEVIFAPIADPLEICIIDGVPKPLVVVEGFKVNPQAELFEDKSFLPVRTSCQSDTPVRYIFDGNGNYVEDPDKLGEQKDLLDRIAMNNLIAMVRQWCDMVIDKEMVKTLPEPFLMLIDYIISEIYAQEQGIKEIPEGRLERYTSGYLLEMIEKKLSLYDTLADEKKYIYLMNISSIRVCFENYDIEELGELKNRYETINLDDGVVDVKEEDVEDISLEISAVEKYKTNSNNECKERCKILLTQLEQLVTTADNFQALDNSDVAQDVAFGLYQQIGILKRRMEEITREHKLTDVSKEFSTLQC